MAETIPAMLGRLGTTDFYIVTMKAQRVAEKIQIASEVEGWENLSLDEKYQRNLSINRVKREIAPYLANDRDRFFGSLIVAVQNGEDMEYEPVKEVGGKFTGAHKSASDNLGFLTLSGQEMFIPIDGQHRAKAIKFAITGRDDSGKELEDVVRDPSLGQEDVVAILIHFDTEDQRAKARKIFNKVNRYAKKPTKSEDLIIDDDDVVAVLSRRMTDDEDPVISGDLVRISGNTLPDRAGEFTTLATLYEINKDILQALGHTYNKGELPDSSTVNLYWDEIVSVWEKLEKGINHYNAAFRDHDPESNNIRQQLRRNFLSCKPIGQRVLFQAFLALTEPANGNSEAMMSKEEAIKRLNLVDWNISSEIWLNILTRDNKRVMSGKAAISLGKEFVCYLCGAPMTDEQLNNLREKIAPDDDTYQLPERVSPTP
jgi:DNA sulfur modification protein DndB